jgi:hypothetical protein
MAWIGENSKDLCPDRVEIVADTIAEASAYWLQIKDFDQNVTGMKAEASAEVDREKNQITVTTNQKVKEFVIYLNDDLLDLDSVITVLHKLKTTDEDAEPAAEERFSGTKARSLEEALEFSFSQVSGDIGEVFVAMIRVEL